MKKYLILIMAAFLTSCGTVKYVPVEKITETITEIVEVIRDTTIYVSSDKATVNALLECDSLGSVMIKDIAVLQGKLNAKTSIIIKDNVITAECECDSIAIYAQLKDRYKTTTTSTSETKIQPVEIKEKKGGIKNWHVILMCIGAAVIGYFVCRIRKVLPL